MITASPQKLEVGGISYEFANLIAHGLASLKSRQLDADLLPMAVWDGRPGDGPGGTAGSVRRWRDQGYAVDVIDLAGIANIYGIEASSPSAAPPVIAVEDRLDTSTDLGLQVVPILFADVVGFSKLTEEEVPRFVRHFLGLIAGVLAKLPPGSVKKKNNLGRRALLRLRGRADCRAVRPRPPRRGRGDALGGEGAAVGHEYPDRPPRGPGLRLHRPRD